MKGIQLFICLLALTFFHSAGAVIEDSLLVDPIQTSSAAIQTKIETEVFNLINQHRVTNFLSPLTLSSIITEQARNHSLNMANKIVPFGHQGADVRFANIRSLIPNVRRFGENVAYNRGFSNPAEIAVSGWLRSSGHYANIMGDYNLTGVGVAKNLQGEYYFTQIFVKTISSSSLKQDCDLNHEIQEISEKHYISPKESICEFPCLMEIDE